MKVNHLILPAVFALAFVFSCSSDGSDGAPGADGKDGTSGVDGKDGKDGVNCEVRNSLLWEKTTKFSAAACLQAI